MGSHIDEALLRDGAVFFVPALRDEFQKYLENYGIDNVKSYRSRSLVARLQKRYEVNGKCKIIVVPQKGCSSLVCSADLSMACMFIKLKELKEIIEEVEEKKKVKMK